MSAEGEVSLFSADRFPSRMTQLTSMLTLYSRAKMKRSSVELLQQPHPHGRAIISRTNSVGGVSDVMPSEVGVPNIALPRLPRHRDIRFYLPFAFTKLATKTTQPPFRLKG